MYNYPPEITERISARVAELEARLRDIERKQNIDLNRLLGIMNNREIIIEAMLQKLDAQQEHIATLTELITQHAECLGALDICSYLGQQALDANSKTNEASNG